MYTEKLPVITPEIPMYSMLKENFCHFYKKFKRFFHIYAFVLEHITTQDSKERVENGSEYVAATITTHHLGLVVDNWAGQNHHFVNLLPNIQVTEKLFVKLLYQAIQNSFWGQILLLMSVK